MFHESKGPGQPGQWLRICASCEWLYIGEHRVCPKCGFAHYGAPMAYGGWVVPIFLLIKQWCKEIIKMRLRDFFDVWYYDSTDEEPRCQFCKYYVKAFSPRPGESWDRCRAKLLPGEVKYRQDNISLEYCSNLNSDKTCPYYKRPRWKRRCPKYPKDIWYRRYW